MPQIIFCKTNSYGSSEDSSKHGGCHILSPVHQLRNSQAAPRGMLCATSKYSSKWLFDALWGDHPWEDRSSGLSQVETTRSESKTLDGGEPLVYARACGLVDVVRLTCIWRAKTCLPGRCRRHFSQHRPDLPPNLPFQLKQTLSGRREECGVVTGLHIFPLRSTVIIQFIS